MRMAEKYMALVHEAIQEMSSAENVAKVEKYTSVQSRHELMTIAIRGPRQSGHTTAAVDLAYRKRCSVLITVNDVSDQYARKVAGRKAGQITFVLLRDIEKPDRGGFWGRGISVKCVIVDNASLVPPGLMDKIYSQPWLDPRAVFVLLG